MKTSSTPQCIFIQTQTGCNGNCIMCPMVEIKKKFPFHRMPDDLFKKIIDDIAAIDYDKELGFYLMYEPLMDPSLFEKIDYAKKKCPKAVMVISTNASVLNKERAEKLLDSKIDWIVFNVNGMTKDVYEKSMPGLRFEQTFENVKNFVRRSKEKGRFHPTHSGFTDRIKNKIFQPKYGTLRLSGNFVRHKLNKHQIKQAKKFWNQLGILVHTDYWAVNRAGNVDNYDELVPEVINTATGDNTRFKSKDEGICFQPFEHINIMSTGEVILCCNDWSKEAVVGNMNHQSLLEIWHGDKFNEYRKKLITQKDLPLICQRCKR